MGIAEINRHSLENTGLYKLVEIICDLAFIFEGEKNKRFRKNF